MNNRNEYTLTRFACYSVNVSMAVVSSLSALLFVTFREIYGISYTLLGLLVVMNFSTQLSIDLIFSFFSKHFNIHKTVRMTPLITVIGLLIYSVMPMIFPNAAYLFIAIGTVIFSVSAGLSEVLMSPTVAAIPSDDPERDMSKLHSTYAWGVAAVVVVSTLYLEFFGRNNWMYLALAMALIPLSSFIMFMKAKLPEMNTSEAGGTEKKGKIGKGLMMCFLCIFLGGAAECTMTQWVSTFMESTLSIPKVWGDIFGMALFALLLGLGRSLYAKYGKNIIAVLIAGMIGAAVCYLTAGISMNPIVGLIACVLTGFCTSMLWPGSIIFVGEKMPGAGVAVYAMMAAGGDLGASVAPQIVGIASDYVGASPLGTSLSASLGMNAEQIGMRAGLLIAAAFPLLGIAVTLVLKRHFDRAK